MSSVMDHQNINIYLPTGLQCNDTIRGYICGYFSTLNLSSSIFIHLYKTMQLNKTGRSIKRSIEELLWDSAVSTHKNKPFDERRHFKIQQY